MANTDLAHEFLEEYKKLDNVIICKYGFLDGINDYIIKLEDKKEHEAYQYFKLTLLRANKIKEALEKEQDIDFDDTDFENLQDIYQHVIESNDPISV